MTRSESRDMTRLSEPADPVPSGSYLSTSPHLNDDAGDNQAHFTDNEHMKTASNNLIAATTTYLQNQARFSVQMETKIDEVQEKLERKCATLESKMGRLEGAINANALGLKSGVEASEKSGKDIQKLSAIINELKSRDTVREKDFQELKREIKLLKDPKKLVSSSQDIPTQSSSQSVGQQETVRVGRQVSNPQVKPAPVAPGSAQAPWSAGPRAPQSVTTPVHYISDKEFVQFLKEMNCTKHEDLVRLQKYVSTPYTREFLLVTKSTTEKFYLRIGGRERQVLRPHRRSTFDLDEPAYQTPTNAEHARAAGLMELIFLGNCHAGDPDASPDYVVHLGEVHLFHRDGRRQHEKRTYTNFHVVMDVGSPAKALWLAYQFDEVDDQGRVARGREGLVFVNYATEFLPMPLQPGGWAGFDFARLTSDLTGWLGLDDGDAGPQPPIANGPDLIARTAVKRKPAFTLPLYEVAMREIKKGWGGGVNGRDE